MCNSVWRCPLCHEAPCLFGARLHGRLAMTCNETPSSYARMLKHTGRPFRARRWLVWPNGSGAPHPTGELGGARVPPRAPLPLHYRGGGWHSASILVLLCSTRRRIPTAPMPGPRRALCAGTTNIHRPPSPAGSARAPQPLTCGLVVQGQGPKAPPGACSAASDGSDRMGALWHVLGSNNSTKPSMPQLKTVWPSGLRRWLKAPFRKGVGSNPTAVRGGAGNFQVEDPVGSGSSVWASVVWWQSTTVTGARPGLDLVWG